MKVIHHIIFVIVMIHIQFLMFLLSVEPMIVVDRWLLLMVTAVPVLAVEVVVAVVERQSAPMFAESYLLALAVQ